MRFIPKFSSIQFKMFAIISTVVIVTALAIFALIDNKYFENMLQNTKKQSQIVSNYSLQVVPASSFSILNNKEDDKSYIYSMVHNDLDQIRQIADILYLYTAKRNDKGQPIYVVDGLPLDSVDFRYIGDLVESEVSSKVNYCLDGGTIDVDNIINTSWGEIFFTCKPIRNSSGSVEGAIVMEFDASHLVKFQKQLRSYSLSLSLILALFAIVFCLLYLKKLIVQPLKNIETSFQSLAEGDFSCQVDENSRISEIQNLEYSFNKMIAQLKSNISKRDEAELAKSYAELASKAKSDFLANMSHEIRTPINGIMGLIYLVLQTELNDKQKNYLSKASGAAKNLLGIINDILDFSKIEAHKLIIEHTSFNIYNSLDDLVSMIQGSTNREELKIVSTFDENIPKILRGDELRIRQVLMNLISNAVKFTERGSIKINFTLLAKTEQLATIEMSITDTGIGMSEEQLGYIFLPFTQADSSTSRKYGGTGLGLVISKQLVELMGGTISVESKLNKGSKFKVQLSLEISNEDTASHEELSNNCKDVLHDKKILVVEDNEINQTITKEILEQYGVKVGLAEDGNIALKRIIEDDYDLILMDIQMPNLNGLEATKLIREKPIYDNIPIIAMTAHAQVSDYEKSINVGMQDHITKPIDPPVFFQTVCHWLNKKL